MQALGTWLTATVGAASAAFALPLLGFAAFMAGFSLVTGNRDTARAWVMGGLIGTAIILAVPQIVASIPRPT